MTSTSTDRRLGVSSGMAVKVPCRVATTAAITLTGEQTIDGVAVVTGDRVLVKDQSTTTYNGIWVCDTGDWSRAVDADGLYDITDGTLVPVAHGTAGGQKVFQAAGTNPITPGTSAITFSVSAVFTAISAFAATLLDDADAAAARATLGLVIGTNVQAYDADIPTTAASQAEMEAGTEAALRSMSPLRIAQAIAALGATPSSGTFTATLTGCTTAPTADMRYVKSGGVVTMTLDTVRWLNATSNATTKTLTGMPATLYPSQTRYFTGLSIDNAAPWAACLCSVSTTGVIAFTKDLAGNAFTGSGAAYCNPCSITYPV